MGCLPSFLSSGETARLIPVVADTSKERRAASVLLAAMMSVDELARSLLNTVGQRFGTRANVECYTEVVFDRCPSEIKIRPDGLLVLNVGKRHWSALIETKIGKVSLDEEQLASYCQLAKLNGVDAVITISNQFAALPTHHPLKPNKSLTKGVELYHWSWMHVLTQSMLLLEDHDFHSPEQRYLLGEMVRYFSHDSVGVSRFDRMNPEWKELVTKVQSGATLNKTAVEVENSVAAWHQEQRDLCLLLSRKLGRKVTLKLTRAHSDDPVRRLKDDCGHLVRSHNLLCTLDVPDAAAPIMVCADIRRRTVTCSMRLTAPKDKKHPRTRIGWVIRQLAKSDAQNVLVKAMWPGRAPDTLAKLADTRENPARLIADDRLLPPNSFEVIMVHDLAGKFSGSKTFIEHLEAAVPDYYEQVGQHLRAWVPAPPKMKEKPAEALEEGSEPGSAEVAQENEALPQP